MLERLLIAWITTICREFWRPMGSVQNVKFGFSDEDMQSVPQAPFKYLRETFKDTAFRASQFKMLHKLIYTKKLLHICRLVDTNMCERP